MTAQHGLTDKTLTQITDVLACFSNVEKAVLFGSRAKMPRPRPGLVRISTRSLGTGGMRPLATASQKNRTDANLYSLGGLSRVVHHAGSSRSR